MRERRKDKVTVSSNEIYTKYFCVFNLILTLVIKADENASIIRKYFFNS